MSKSMVLKKLLIVDDEAVIRTLIERMLKNENYQLSFASTMREGKSCVDQDRFDLLLTDLRLPDGNGIEIIRDFKTKFPEAAVLVMTGSLTPEERLAQAPEHSVIACIQKPFNLDILQQAISQALDMYVDGKY
jgi:two-component system response regulator HydG